MIPKPGQGFRLGNSITIKAIPYPLPAGIAADLVKAGKRVAETRFTVEKIKDGCTPQKDAAVAEYEKAVAGLNTTEVMIRHAYGVEYTRNEILSFKGF